MNLNSSSLEYDSTLLDILVAFINLNIWTSEGPDGKYGPKMLMFVHFYPRASGISQNNVSKPTK